MILEIVLSVLVLLGGFFAFVAGLGILRLPDVLIRMHATTKAGTLASGLIMAAVALGLGDSATVARAVAIVLFLLLTAPVAAHMIGRAAFRAGVPLWETDIDRTADEKLGVLPELARRRSEGPRR
ncbi:monovalent cation/H(+) antiporter subunit G [Jannaschia seohaensis]|uniref:Multicomponent Na+:H+ antiporter subunit G n=1 Tax=Jannaschia seohaensis TaxID=475081 RepID=A0A2Y9B596_9RHOB|nr:monovalent cation/H(+) antiporter subunit G [Jannaschia seohaensis]PWJ12082.1 multicomponent Na+:H+ antiporter subunit G [Jannaschia seohaensis]SSA51185.1 multicomponent Na+:H+ antiporter subunit G [Jannaschia seohaensis]